MTRLLHQPLGLLHRPMGGLRHQVGSYSQKVLDLFGSNLIGYWPMNENTGSVANDISPEGNDGAYTGVTLANTALPSAIGGSAPLFDGTNDYMNPYSAGLNADFDGQEFTFGAWLKMSGSGVWTDGQTRYVLHFRVDASNDLSIYKGVSRIDAVYTAGGTGKTVTKSSMSDTDWFFLAWTVSKTADAFNGYYNGALEADQETGLGTWAGNLLSTVSTIGSQNTTPGGVWDGWIAHAFLLNRAATAPEILKLAQWGGVA